MSITKLNEHKSEPKLQQKYDVALQEIASMREHMESIWWILTDVRDGYQLDVGQRTYLNAAILLAEPFVDHEK